VCDVVNVSHLYEYLAAPVTNVTSDFARTGAAACCVCETGTYDSDANSSTVRVDQNKCGAGNCTNALRRVRTRNSQNKPQRSSKVVSGQPFGHTVLLPSVPHVGSTACADSNHVPSESVKTELVDDGRPCSSRLTLQLEPDWPLQPLHPL
jgi:hypothetical protein